MFSLRDVNYISLSPVAPYRACLSSSCFLGLTYILFYPHFGCNFTQFSLRFDRCFRASQAIAESVEFMRSSGMLDKDRSGGGNHWRMRVLVTAAAAAAAAALVYWLRMRA